MDGWEVADQKGSTIKGRIDRLIEVHAPAEGMRAIVALQRGAG